MKNKIPISIIYVYFNTPDEILQSIASLTKAVGTTPFEIIVVDNNSEIKLPVALKKMKNFRIITNKKNTGYGSGVNRGVEEAVGECILVVNPDVVFEPLSIKLMLGALKKDRKIGVIGPKFRTPDGEISPSVSGIPFLPNAILIYSLINKIFPENLVSKKFWMRDLSMKKMQEVPAIGGACMLFRKEAFEKVGGFDPQFFLYFEESDICYRIKKAGHTVIFYPDAGIIHAIGRSQSDKKNIQKYFEKSRFRFFKKYHGFHLAILGEGMIRLLTPSNLALFGIIGVSILLNFYKIDELLIFQGDFGRDLLAARAMVLTGQIPLLGIPSSVIWLHQGPLSIYFIGVALFFGNFHPAAPAMLYAGMGVISTFLVYFLGKQLFSQKPALVSAALYATSPLIIINARIPYHTAPIPFFTLLFFLVLWKVINGKLHLVFPLFFLLGLLLQLELSNAVLIALLGLIWWYYKIPVTVKVGFAAFGGLALGVLPFILYDVMNRFIQIGGLFLWIANRIRLFFGLTTSGNATTQYVDNAAAMVAAEVVRMVYGLSPLLVLAIVIASVLLIVVKRQTVFQRKPNALFLLVVWVAIPIVGFLVHARPGPAYFPLLYPAIILFYGYTVFWMAKKARVLYILVIIMIVFNVMHLVAQDYFVVTDRSQNIPTLYGYGYGASLVMQQKVVDFMIHDSNGERFAILGGGFLKQFASSVDNYKYLVLWKGGKYAPDARIQYIIYENQHEIPKDSNVVFSNHFLQVIKR